MTAELAHHGPAAPALLAASQVSKRFHGTQALDRVSFEVAAGELHALVGENGAGKSTLIKILGGIYPRDAGDIRLDGRSCHFDGPRAAQAAGIVIIPQEMRLVPTATVAENVTLGHWPSRRLLGVLPIVDTRRMRERAVEALARLRFRGDPNQRLDRLGFAERQLVAIAKALCQAARVLILDEPTASLEQHEAERLFDLLAGLKAEGVGIVFVSHRLDEVVRLGDRCTVLRDGRVVAVCPRGEVDPERLVRLMTGRDLEELHRPHGLHFGESLLATSTPAPAGHEPAAVQVRAGEIVGVAGLLGSGTSELLRHVYGAGDGPATVTVRGTPRRIGHPIRAIRAGIGLVPGERRLGLVMNLSIRDNILLPHLDRFRRRGRLHRPAMDRLAARLIETLDIRPPDPGRPVRELSGGNQQKVIFARWLAGQIDLLLLDEPTHGIDIGAKARIHRLMREFAGRGGGILFASAEMVEMVAMSDSVLAMRRGGIVGRLSRRRGDYSEGALRALLGG